MKEGGGETKAYYLGGDGGKKLSGGREQNYPFCSPSPTV